MLAHQVTAALGLHLVLNVACSETGADVLLDGAGDVGRTTEATTILRLDCIVKTWNDLPSVGISNDRNGGIE